MKRKRKVSISIVTSLILLFSNGSGQKQDKIEDILVFKMYSMNYTYNEEYVKVYKIQLKPIGKYDSVIDVNATFIKSLKMPNVTNTKFYIFSNNIK